MENSEIQSQLQDIQNQLTHITAELDNNKRRQRELDELKDDLTIIAKDVFNTAVIELEDTAQFVNTGDFLFLIKKIIRNTNNISAAICQFESLLDFFEDGKPIGKELFNDLLILLDEMDRKGYFLFMKETTRIVDNVIANFTIEDVQNLADNIVTILNTIKKLTQPDMMRVLDNAVEIYRTIDLNDVKEYSVWQVAKELRQPEFKRGMGFIVSFLKNIANQSGQPTKGE